MNTETKTIVDRIANAFVDEVVERLLNSTDFVEKLVASPAFMKVAVFPTVKPENIQGLDKFVEEKVDESLAGFEVEADNVEGIEEKISEGITEAMRDLEVEADNVDGLDSAIEDHLDNAEIKASNISDLGEAIEEVIAGNKSIQDELKLAILKGLTVTVETKLDGQPIQSLAA